jgi:hypothetical protein
MSNRALIIGIWNYPVRPLNGPQNDRIAWTELLSKPPFSFDVTALDNPDKPAFLKAFTKLIGKPAKDDRLVFICSSHGTRIGVNGSTRDGFVTPFSGAAPDASSIVITDELTAILDASSLRGSGAELTYIFDTCHAEIGVPPARAAFVLRAAEMMAADRVRFMPAAKRVAAPPPQTIARAPRRPAATPAAPLSFEPLLLAATDAGGTAYEGLVNGEERGLYSAYMIEQIRQQPTIRHSTLNTNVYHVVNAQHADQQPQIIGPRTANAFLQ